MMKFESISKAKKQTGLSYLGGINLSEKIMKNQKVFGIMTYSLYLSPAKTSGYDACPHSTHECRLGCLATSGRNKIEILGGKSTIMDARIKKTKLFFEENQFFMHWLVAEIASYKKIAEKKGYGFSVRLNCTSDIDWDKFFVNGQNVFDIFNDVNFYDYTKIFSKFLDIAPNYHLTFSFTGGNWDACEKLLNKGHNIAMVFNVKKESELPSYYKGFKVINGDESDYRIADQKGVIIGLKWKRIANKEAEKEVLNSRFVVQPTDVNCTYSELKMVI